MTLKPQLCPYEINRAYVCDNADLLGPDITEVILGANRARDYKLLAAITGRFPDALQCPVSWKILRQVEAFFKKNADFAEDASCELAAKAAFERGELLCRLTNKRLDHYYVHTGRLDPELQEYIRRAETYIRRTLGSYKTFLRTLPSAIRITSGASALTPRSRSVPFMKLQRSIAVTPQCRPLAAAMLTHLGYTGLRLKTVAWNRVEFVPKNWKTHRAIACEPAANVPFQLAFDRWAKRRLLHKGINLRDQSTNQNHAYIGSIDGSLATVDLSMASDTVSYNTVRWLLPDDWFQYLDRVRSPLFQMEGKTRKYAKFSSMGNGATFALESLIFASFLHAVGSRKGVTYGDDITVETELYPELVRLLQFFGFVPNLEKSFSTGPFRESCGFDYHSGQDVTPFYLRKTDAWNKPYACHNVNGLANLSSYGLLWDYLKSFTEKAKLPLVPVNEDTLTGVFITPHLAYQQRLIRTDPERPFVQQARMLLLKSTTKRCWDSRALGLWFLHRPDRGVTPWEDEFIIPVSKPADGFDGYESSRYTISGDKFSRLWQNWQPPVTGLPTDLYGWSSLLMPPSKAA